jgi:hypothetical protein
LSNWADGSSLIDVITVWQSVLTVKNLLATYEASDALAPSARAVLFTSRYLACSSNANASLDHVLVLPLTAIKGIIAINRFAGCGRNDPTRSTSPQGFPQHTIKDLKRNFAHSPIA